MLIKGLGLGGAERHAVDIAKAIKALGHDVEVAYVIPSKNALVEELLQHGVVCHCLGGGAFRWLSVLTHYPRLIRRFRPTVVHTHLPTTGIVARLFKPVFKYWLVYTEHNVIIRLHPLTRVLHRVTRRFDDRAVSCSQAVADSLPWESTVLTNGIPIPDLESRPIRTNRVRERFGLSSETIIFMSVANLLRKKNHALMLSAFDCAFGGWQETSRPHLVLVGQYGTERLNLERRAASLRVQKQIHFWGGDPHAADLLPCADAFCLSSDFEGLPIALLEAMAAGLPAIVTNAGGMSSVIDEHTGIVVPTGSEEEFAQAFVKLATNAGVRKKLGENARRRVGAHYSHDAMMQRLLCIYSAR